MSESLQKNLNDALYGKMQTELRDYEKWLECKSAHDALLYAREYCLMEGFLDALEENDLSVYQAEMLLSLQKPLKYMVEAYEISGMDDMERLFACLESCAETLMIAHPLMRLKDRVESNYQDFREQWLKMTPEELIVHCEKLEAVTRMAKELPGALTEEDAEYLLRFKNPLEIVSDEWTRRNSGCSLYMDDEMKHLLWELRDRGYADDAYELDAQEYSEEG